MPSPLRLLLLVPVGLVACSSRQPMVASQSSTTASPAAAGTPFTSITFERTPCFGTCPVYRVTVAGDGTVRFIGERHVDSVGTFTGVISAASVAALGRAFDEAKYFELDSKYAYSEPNCREYGTDASRVLTTMTTPTRSKHIDHDLGCGNVPAQLPDLYRKFDAIVGTARWVGRR